MAGNGGPLRVDIHLLSRQAGSVKHVELTVPAPEEWRVGLIGVAAGSAIAVGADLEAVGEGVLASGQAAFTLTGQCARCLAPIEAAGEALFQELFYYPGRGEGDDDLARVEGETVDLEPVVRDAIVLDLPLAPLCEDDCAGLCPDCGANLNEDATHSHGPQADARWAGLADWVPSDPEE
jgi:uncharacterized protein